MLGMHGTFTANLAMDNADLIVGIGARFDDRITGKLSEFAPNAKIIHIDIDPAEISKNVGVDIPIVGDVKRVLPKLSRENRALRPIPPARRLVDPAARLEGAAPALLRARRGRRDQPQFMIEAMHRATQGDAIVTTDVGQHQMWAAQYYRFDNRAASSPPAAWGRWASASRGGRRQDRLSRRDGRLAWPATAA